MTNQNLPPNPLQDLNMLPTSNTSKTDVGGNTSESVSTANTEMTLKIEYLENELTDLNNDFEELGALLNRQISVMKKMRAHEHVLVDALLYYACSTSKNVSAHVARDALKSVLGDKK